MSTISTTISTNIFYGSGQQYPSPLTITNSGAVILNSNTASVAVQGVGGGSLVNDGTILGSASGNTGVLISGSGGTVNNSGLIQAYLRALYIQGSALVTNTGVIRSTGASAAAAVEDRGGTLTNSGTIINNANTGDGVRIDAAGATVANSGFIQGYFAGLLTQPGYVTNSGLGTIVAVGHNAAGVLVNGIGSGTVTNRGTINATASNGTGVNVQSIGGGTVVNYGVINAYSAGINVLQTGVVTNSGTIRSTGANGHAAVQFAAAGTLTNTGSIISTNFAQTGVEIGASGIVTNTGFIQGYVTSVDLGGAGVVINSGTIASKETPFIAYQANVMLTDGGSVTNTQAGLITNCVFVADGGDANVSGTVIDAGTITGGIALNLNSNFGGGFPVPTYYGSGTVFLSGTVSGASFNPLPITFGGTNALLVLEHGYKINGNVEGIGNKYPHTVELLGSAAAAVTVNFTPTSFINFGTVAFASGTANYGTIALGTSADVPGTIAAFTSPHDVVDLQYISDTNHDATAILDRSTDKLTVTGDNGSTVLQLDSSTDYSAISFEAVPDAAGTGTDVFAVVCFCEGTQIQLEHGEAPVEDLKVGDVVRLLDGSTKPIVWIGEGRVLATRGRRTAATPVIVRKDALGDNVPNRDLRITKAHSLYIDDVLIPVEFLVNHRTILWDDRAREVSIYHIELETHAVLLANGAPSESYRDDGNRWLFRNGNSGWDLPPKAACAPVLTGGPVVDAVWLRLLDRAGPRSGLPITDDPDLHLLVNGKRLDGERGVSGNYCFCLTDVPTALRIVSRAAIPQELGLTRDPRMLGVAVRRIAICQRPRWQIIDADDGLLGVGFHSFEPDNGFRWTNGDAVIPAEAFTDFTGPVEIVLTVASTMHYLYEGIRLQVA